MKIRSLLIVVLGTFLLLEALLRLAGYAYARWRLPPSSEPPRAGEYRILCVGDSFTFGIGAPKGYSYPEQLQRRLDETQGARPYRVINRGVPSSNSTQTLAALPDALDELEPHLVLVLTGRNDVNVTESDYWRVLGPEHLTTRARLMLHARDRVRRLRTYKVLNWLATRSPAPTNLPDAPWRRYDELDEPEVAGSLKRLERRRRQDAEAFKEWLGLGILLHRAKRFPEALDAYRQAVRRDPDDAEARFRLGWMLLLVRDLPASKKELQSALERDPRHQRARQMLGAIRKDPSSVDPEIWLGPLLEYNFARLHELTRRRGITVVLQNYPNPDPRLENALGPVLEAAARRGVPVLDHGARFRALPDPLSHLSGDEPEIRISHPNAKGYRLMAESVYQKLRELSLAR